VAAVFELGILVLRDLGDRPEPPHRTGRCCVSAITTGRPKGGQAIFGIGLGHVATEITTTLGRLPAETPGTNHADTTTGRPALRIVS
jgi:hypothetical protein